MSFLMSLQHHKWPVSGGGSGGVSYTAISSAGVTNYYSISVPYVTGVPAGTLLVLIVSTRQSKLITSGPDASWTLVTTLPAYGGGQVYSYVYTKMATGSESGSIYMEIGSWGAWGGVMLAFSGASGIGAYANNAGTTGYNNIASCPSITASAGSFTVSYAAALYGGPVTPTVTSGTIIYRTTAQAGNSVGIQIEGPTTAGATTARSFTMDYNDRHSAFTLEILKA
jgi:hypothetical protein